jgi:hypothetical protein
VINTTAIIPIPPITIKSVGCNPPKTLVPSGRLEGCVLVDWVRDDACTDVMFAAEVIETKVEALLIEVAEVLMVVSWLVAAARVMGTMSPELQAAPFQAL